MSKQNPKKQILATSFGQIAYLQTGQPDKPPVLFIHGIPTSGHLWRNVIRYLQNDYNCYAPDLMGLGHTNVDPDTTSFHMDAQAEMLLEFMSELGHDRFSVVCHDQGGAAAQIMMARTPDRLEFVVLTDCVCYDNWPVSAIKRLQALARLPLISRLASRSGLIDWLETRTPLSAFRRGVYDDQKLSSDTIKTYLDPLAESERSYRSFQRFLLAGHPRYTELALSGLKKFDKPTLVIWAADDAYLSPSWGVKLKEEIPGATRFELVPFCGHFWQEERPAEFASRIGEFFNLAFKEQAAARGEVIESVELPPAPTPNPPRKRKKKKVLSVAE